MSATRRRRAFASMAFALLGAVAGLVSPGCGRPPERPPNILLVTFDALRRDHLSSLGYPRQTTPSIDALAARGTVWTQVIPTSCSTKASLTSLLTSLDFASHHVIEHEAILDPAFETLAETLHRNGYSTLGSVATAHLARPLGYDQGFDTFHDFRNVDVSFVDADLVVEPVLEAVANRRASDPPFFAYLHFEEPHPPWLHESPWVENGTPDTRFFGEGCGYVPSSEELRDLPEETRHDLIGKYDGALRFADERLGRLIDALERTGELGNTVVAVTADHGLELLDRYSASHGYDPHDEVVRGFLVLYDGRAERSSPRIVDDVQGRIFDIGPTLLAAAGIPVPAGIDGLDLASRAGDLPEYAYTTCYGFESMRSLRWKLVSFRHKDAKEWYHEVRRPLGMPDSVRLFDLVADSGETTDVGGEHRELLFALFRDLKRHRARPRILEAPVQLLDESKRSKQEVERLRALGYL